MAFYDWNKNGKKDLADDYIEYNIFKECTKDEQKNYVSDSPKREINGWTVVKWYVVIMTILLLFKACFGPRCDVADCDKERVKNSVYCRSHDLTYRLYGSATYYEEKKIEKEIEKYNEKMKEKEEAEKPEKTSTPSRRSYYVSSFDDSENEDRFGVDDFYSAEDFYEKYEDYFDDYLDAKDYYNRHHKEE